MKYCHNRKESRQRLLDVAENIFSLHGYDASSVRSIAAGAHLNISMINYYFGSKEKLLFAVVSRRITEFQERINDATVAELDTSQRLSGLIALNMELMFEHRQFFRFLLKELRVDSTKHTMDTVRLFFHSNLSLLQEILKEGINKKIFDISDPELISYGILSTLIHSIIDDQFGFGQSEERKKERIQEFFNYYFLSVLRGRKLRQDNV